MIRTRQTKPLSILALLLCLGACRSATTPGPTSLPPRADTAFKLEPGDVVRVEVWREKDLKCECRVDEVGRLTLPMLGVINATSILWTDLRDSIQTGYGRQLRNPSVTLTPLRRVWVLGEVTKPGPLLADPTLSLAGLVAMAGGATPGGDLHRVRVVRGGQTIIESASVESLLLLGVRSNDQVFVDRRAWIERNGSVVASVVLSGAGILITLLKR